jgi:hypothetical protein
MSDLSLFDKKQLIDFSDKIQKVFNLLTISRKFRVVGSAALKNIRYVNDYDLNELYSRNFDTKEALDLIYKMFVEKFQVCEKDPNCFITDLKCGVDSDGEALRWDKKDIKKGFKELEDGRKLTFQECILSKSTFKLDVVKIIDGVFTEFSDNYFIKLGEETNFFPHNLTKDHLQTSLKQSYEEYFYNYQNLYKGLKRAFSYYLMEGEGKNAHLLKKLMKLFNSPVGKLYNVKGQLGTILLVMENKNGFRVPKIKDIKRNIQLIWKSLEYLPVPDIRKKLMNAMKVNTLPKMKRVLEDIEEDLFDIINSLTLSWTLANKEIPIY